ncbi:uncharacterized protein Tco025E_06628 [Trypanosoma conorhini]|uniref:Uncharacterized protein n=1 Tax=Trypanosoma conorhini TaxID=83891 RepID=A0A422P1H5_9TRYP|nr:uncharacterized protein Tco025E_06628 [Trypanosoma conorhini]RNF11593.1 hypothetical protein Tco025E_06628 [Trypanosoma conorhini]
MSVLGVSSYFLWTQKGKTVLPLVRGSGFLVSFQQIGGFYRYHVLGAAHVTCPVKYRQIYGDTVGLRAIGERHISTKLLKPGSKGAVEASIDLEFAQTYLPNVDVSSLRCKDERQLSESCLRAFELDLGPIKEGTELLFWGVKAEEERANPNDDGLRLKEACIEGECRAALVSLDYGTVVLASLGSPLVLSMCGGPVVRKDNGRCVGVIVAQALKNAPPSDPQVTPLCQDPWLDLSHNEVIHTCGKFNVAFVPVREFYDPLRRCEM